MSDLNVNLPEKLLEAPNEVVKALALPVAQTVGDTFSELFFLAFGGIGHAAEKRRIKYKLALEAFERECREKIDSGPAERQKEPSTQIIMQTFENAKSCVEEKELRELFANLVAVADLMGTSPRWNHYFVRLL